MSSFTPLPTLDLGPPERVPTTQPGSRGGSRVVEIRGGFDLNIANNTLIVALPKCVAAGLSITLQAGAWGTATLSLKIPVPGTLLAFATAKNLSAEGVLSLSETECLGLTQVAVVVTAAAGAFALAAITTSVEEAP